MRCSLCFPHSEFPEKIHLWKTLCGQWQSVMVRVYIFTAQLTSISVVLTSAPVTHKNSELNDAVLLMQLEWPVREQSHSFRQYNNSDTNRRKHVYMHSTSFTRELAVLLLRSTPSNIPSFSLFSGDLLLLFKHFQWRGAAKRVTGSTEIHWFTSAKGGT